jgi:protein gp37
MGNPRYRRGFRVTLHEDLLNLPRKWKKPRKVFVNSMSDLFHEEVPAEFIAKMFATMAACPQHTFQALTKRSGRLAELAPELPWPPNLWMGVSVENERVLHRVDDLRKVPAAVRFLSCEPLLGPLGALDLDGIDWVIAGGESGPGARPMNLDWARSLRDRCAKAHVAFFFKQVGGVQKHRTGRHLDGRTHDEMPEPVDRFGFVGSAFQTQVAIP